MLTGFTDTLDAMLRNSVTNSAVCLERLQAEGYAGGVSSIKDYIAAHRDLVPAKRQAVAPQKPWTQVHYRPGEAFQMDWGFTKVQEYPRQRKGIHGGLFRHGLSSLRTALCGVLSQCQAGKPVHRDDSCVPVDGRARIYPDGQHEECRSAPRSGRNPVWQPDYEAFMRTVGFKTKLCKPRHPFTKGKVERLIRFVKENFLVDRVFYNLTDLNRQALEWCDRQNNIFHKAVFGIPQEMHFSACAEHVRKIEDSLALRCYLCPVRKITFDGFVNYEGRRFGVPYRYVGATVRVMRRKSEATIYIYSLDLSQLLVTHEVTWSRRDSFLPDQYVAIEQPEEYPSMPVKTKVKMLPRPGARRLLPKFNFDKEAD